MMLPAVVFCSALRHVAHIGIPPLLVLVFAGDAKVLAGVDVVIGEGAPGARA